MRLTAIGNNIIQAGGSINISGNVISGCHTGGIYGNKNVKTEDRQVSPFTQICINGPVNLCSSRGESSLIHVTAEENILPFIRTTVADGCLNIDMEDGVFFIPIFNGG